MPWAHLGKKTVYRGEALTTRAARGSLHLAERRRFQPETMFMKIRFSAGAGS
jgi:hypothetical protein